MSVHRFLADNLVIGDVATITDSEHHHLRDVLRLRPGDHIVVCDSAGVQFAAVLEAVERDKAVARVLCAMDSPPITRITLFQALLKSAKMDLVVQKATELGVRSIVPVLAERCVAKVDESNLEMKLGRWRRIASEAVKQCGRASVPEITGPIDAAGAAAKIGDFGRSVVFWEGDKQASIADALAGTDEDRGVAVVVGPEGGMTEQEVGQFVGAGAAIAGFGDLVLRSETAAIAGVAIVSYELARRGRDA